MVKQRIQLLQIKNPYQFRAYRNAAYSAPAGQALVVFDAKIYDYNNNFNTSTGAYTVPVTGIYTFMARLSVNANTRSFFDIFVNGVASGRSGDVNATAPVGTSMAVDIPLTAGDVITIQFYTQNAGTVEVDNNRCYFIGRYVGGA